MTKSNDLSLPLIVDPRYSCKECSGYAHIGRPHEGRVIFERGFPRTSCSRDGTIPTYQTIGSWFDKTTTIALEDFDPSLWNKSHLPTNHRLECHCEWCLAYAEKLGWVFYESVMMWGPRTDDSLSSDAKGGHENA